MTKNEKIFSISIMRVIAMTMIVAYHSIYFYSGMWTVLGGIYVPIWEKANRFLDSIDLSMFVFISGFLFGNSYIHRKKYRDKKQFILGKIHRLIIPYIVWGVFLIISFPSLFNWGDLLFGICHLWFLLMLFWIFLLSITLSTMRKEPLNNLSIVSISIILYLSWIISKSYSPHHHLLCIESSISYTTAFFIGFACAEKEAWRFSSTFVFPVTLMAIAAIFFHFFFFLPFKSDIIEDFYIRFFSYISIVGLFIILNHIKIPSFILSIVDKLDNLCMGIYIFNPIILISLLLIPSVNRWFVINYQIGPLLLFFISFFIPLLISLFLNNKYLSWLSGN